MTTRRFTEITRALSGAGPASAGGRLWLRPATETPWLGHSIGVTAQLLDETGRGVPSARITCIASEGILSARDGLERQKGGSITLRTEPGGVVRFELGPALAPPLDPGPSAALDAELARLDAKAPTPDAASKSLAEFVRRYRAEGSVALRVAVDRLFNAFPAQAQNARAPWPIRPLTLIAVSNGAEGQAELVTTVTLRVRNWLGGWLEMLRDSVSNDTRLLEALKNLDKDAEAGADLSQAIMRATQAFSGLEQGEQGARLRDAVAGHPVTRYLNGVAPLLKGDAIIDTVRTAGASETAIASGGFAVFQAIRTVQDVEDTINTRSGSPDRRVAALDKRLGVLEEIALKRPDLDGLRDRLTATDTRLDAVERRTLTRADLDALEARLTERLRRTTDRRIAGVKAELVSTRADLTERIDAKAGTQELSELNKALRTQGGETRKLIERIGGVEKQVTELRRRPSRGPNRTNR